MKKNLLIIFVILFFLFSINVLLAAGGNTSLFMATWVKFNSNDPPQLLPEITVTDQDGGNITPANGISIILPKDMDILWDQSVTQLTANDKLVDVTYSKNLKNLNIPVTKAFAIGESVKITGQKVRIYDRGYPYQNLQLDVNGDDVGDAVGANGIQIDDTTKRTDLLAPYPITGLTYQVAETSVTLSWENPPDPDYNGIFLKRTVTRAQQTTFFDSSIDKLATQYIDTDVKKGDVIEYEFKTKDNVNNIGEALSASIQMPEEQTVIVQEQIPLEQPEEQKQVEQGTTTSILSAVTQEDLNAVLAKYKDVTEDLVGFKELAYLVKSNALKGAGGKLKPNKQITYSELANIAGKSFAVKKEGTYLKTFKKLGYFSKTAKSFKKLTRKKAFKILLKIKGVNQNDVKTIVNISSLKGTSTRVDLAVWIVKLLDL